MLFAHDLHGVRNTVLPPLQVPTSSVQDFQIFNGITEAINGRSAMLGFVGAVVSEALLHQSVWSQVAGRYENMEMIEAPVGSAPLLFGMIVALVTMSSLAPVMLAGEKTDSREFGPFTPSLESTVGRVAQMGFLGLLVVEAVKGSSLL